MVKNISGGAIRVSFAVLQKKYYEKYTEKEIYLIGIEFSKTDRNITRFEWEQL